MPADDPNSHTASIEVAVDAETAFEYMASGMNQRRWALGSWERVDHGDGLFSGTSLWDASTLYVRLEPHPELSLLWASPREVLNVVQAAELPASSPLAPDAAPAAATAR